MPSVDQLSKLFKALAGNDLQAAEQIADQIAADEDRKGHRTAAQLLRGSLVRNGTSIHSRERTRKPDEGQPLLTTALSRQVSKVRLDDVILRHRTRNALDEIVKEFRGQVLLRGLGIRRRSKLLLYGPPGCGKSLTAQALANELELPLFAVRFDSIIGAYLGQTATHLRQLFQFAESTECVLLFDEIDALGKRRGSLTDVGELDRIVIALMQELELSQLRGFVVATSNLPESLDPALWRRFDLSILLPLPSRRELARFSKIKAQGFGLSLSKGLTIKIESQKSYADAERVVEDEARRRALRSL